MVKEKITEKTRTVTVAVAASEAKSVRFVTAKKNGYRVMDGEKIGVYGATGDCDDEEDFGKAEKNLGKNGIPYPVEATAGRKESVDTTGELLSDKEFVERTKELLAALRERCPRFIFSNNVLKVNTETSLVNDAGLDLRHRTGYYVISLVMKDRDSANVFDLGYSYEGRTFDVEAMVKDVEELSRAWENPVDIEEGEYPVLTSVYDLGINKIYEGICADFYANGTGLFAGKCGQQVFDERVTLYEDRAPGSSIGVAFFDDEGSVNEGYRNVVFEKGVFVRPIASKSDAVKYGLTPTGSAAAAYDGVPKTGLAGLKAESSGKTIGELIGDGKAVFILMASGGDTTSDGNFATPVQVAFLYENGKLTGRLPAIGVSGNLFDLYGKNYIGLASDSLSFTDGEGNKPLIVRMKVTK